jgi:hypothetical protein
MPTREEVYKAIDSERAYQDSRWNEHTTTTKGQHTVSEWLLYMQDYLTQGINQASRNPDPQATEMCLNTIRKITAMGVCCMEQLGAPRREMLL